VNTETVYSDRREAGVVMTSFLATGTPGDSPLIDSLISQDPGYQAVLASTPGVTQSQYLAGSCVQAGGSNPCSGSPYAFNGGSGPSNRRP